MTATARDELDVWTLNELRGAVVRLSAFEHAPSTAHATNRGAIIDAVERLSEAVDALVAAVERPTLRVVR